MANATSQEAAAVNSVYNNLVNGPMFGGGDDAISSIGHLVTGADAEVGEAGVTCEHPSQFQTFAIHATISVGFFSGFVSQSCCSRRLGGGLYFKLPILCPATVGEVALFGPGTKECWRGESTLPDWVRFGSVSTAWIRLQSSKKSAR